MHHQHQDTQAALASMPVATFPPTSMPATALPPTRTTFLPPYAQMAWFSPPSAPNAWLPPQNAHNAWFPPPPGAHFGWFPPSAVPNAWYPPPTVPNACLPPPNAQMAWFPPSTVPMSYFPPPGLQLLRVLPQSETPDAHRAVLCRLAPPRLLAKIGRVDLIREVPSEMDAMVIASVAGAVGRVHVLEWLRATRAAVLLTHKILKGIFNAAIVHAHIEVMEFCVANGLDVQAVLVGSMLTATQHCQPEALQRLRAYAQARDVHFGSPLTKSLRLAPNLPAERLIATLEWWKAEYASRPGSDFCAKPDVPFELACRVTDGRPVIDWWRKTRTDPIAIPALNEASLWTMFMAGNLPLCQWWWSTDEKLESDQVEKQKLMVELLDDMCDDGQVQFLDWFWDLTQDPRSGVTLPASWRPHTPFRRLDVIHWWADKAARGQVDPAVISLASPRTDATPMEILFREDLFSCSEEPIELVAIEWWWDRREQFNLKPDIPQRALAQWIDGEMDDQLMWYLSRCTSDSPLPAPGLTQLAAIVGRGRADLMELILQLHLRFGKTLTFESKLDPRRRYNKVAVSVALDAVWDFCVRLGARFEPGYTSESALLAVDLGQLEAARWWYAMHRVHGFAFPSAAELSSNGPSDMPLDTIDVVELVLCTAAAQVWSVRELADLAAVLPRPATSQVLSMIIARGHPRISVAQMCGSGAILPLHLLRRLDEGELADAAEAAAANGHVPILEHFARVPLRSTVIKCIWMAASRAGRVDILEWAAVTWPEMPSSQMPDTVAAATVHGRLRALEWWWAHARPAPSIWPHWQLQLAADAGQLEAVRWWWSRRGQWAGVDGQPPTIDLTKATAAGHISVLAWAVRRVQTRAIRLAFAPTALVDAVVHEHEALLDWWWAQARVEKVTLPALVPLDQSWLDHEHDNMMPFRCNASEFMRAASTCGRVDLLDWIWARMPYLTDTSFFASECATESPSRTVSAAVVREMLVVAKTGAVMDWWVARAPPTHAVPRDDLAVGHSAHEANIGAIEWWEAKFPGVTGLHVDRAVMFWRDTAALDWWWERRLQQRLQNHQRSRGDKNSPLTQALPDGLCGWLFEQRVQTVFGDASGRDRFMWWWRRICSLPPGSMDWNQHREPILATAAALGCIEPLQRWWDGLLARNQVRVQNMLAEAIRYGHWHVLAWLLPFPPVAGAHEERYQWTMSQLNDPAVRGRVFRSLKLEPVPHPGALLWWRAVCEVHGWVYVGTDNPPPSEYAVSDESSL
ncbi:hypothetical protein BC828DRAFT_409120 [Blastocladiella britannica]|nr:hypothetical protein BC828DRAFT_409120 [Blastocladiella britannica]